MHELTRLHGDCTTTHRVPRRSGAATCQAHHHGACGEELPHTYSFHLPEWHHRAVGPRHQALWVVPLSCRGAPPGCRGALPGCRGSAIGLPGLRCRDCTTGLSGPRTGRVHVTCRGRGRHLPGYFQRESTRLRTSSKGGPCSDGLPARARGSASQHCSVKRATSSGLGLA